jgi:glycosidase
MRLPRESGGRQEQQMAKDKPKKAKPQRRPKPVRREAEPWQCPYPGCGDWETWTHYRHLGTNHEFDLKHALPSVKRRIPSVTRPLSQPCPIDGALCEPHHSWCSRSHTTNH